METIKRFLVDSWRAKLVSLFIAISIWYLIRSHLESARREFPVPGTAPPVQVPIPIPIPGGEPKGG
jgi:hypothetical protein